MKSFAVVPEKRCRAPINNLKNERVSCKVVERTQMDLAGPKTRAPENKGFGFPQLIPLLKNRKSIPNAYPGEKVISGIGEKVNSNIPV